jgi:hypothetical protein
VRRRFGVTGTLRLGVEEMIQKLAVNHLVYTTTRSFEDVIKAFETVVDTLEDIGWASIPSAAKDVADFEARVNTSQTYLKFQDWPI